MKNNLLFPEFENELKIHSAPGYHLIESVAEEIIDDCDNEEYLSFLKLVGSGVFYAGSLQIFFPKGDRLREFNAGLGESISGEYLVIGYDGTTEGCFAIRKRRGDNGIYYINRKQPRDITKLSNSFHQWIENSPSEFYNPKLYKAFGNIKELNKIREVILERKAIKVSLKLYDKELVAHPNAEKYYLKRYNRLLFEIELSKPLFLKELTIKILRTGSPVGDDNIEYLTLSIDGSKFKQTVEAYLFDPFNLPFDKIISLYNPEINLNSKMRIRYKEILEYL